MRACFMVDVRSAGGMANCIDWEKISAGSTASPAEGQVEG